MSSETLTAQLSQFVARAKVAPALVVHVGGRLRANWIVSLNAPNPATTAAIDKSGAPTIEKGIAVVSRREVRARPPVRPGPLSDHRAHAAPVEAALKKPSSIYRRLQDVPRIVRDTDTELELANGSLLVTLPGDSSHGRSTACRGCDPWS